MRILPSLLAGGLAIGWLIGGEPAKSADPIEVSTRRLQVIGRALAAFERKHQQWPDHLSDLVPEFLPDKSALLDPADPGTGDLGSDQALKDPNFHVSYSYERSSSVSNGLAQPLGTFPKPDIPGAGWGSWRLVNGRMEYFFGDQVPLVRCFLHRPPADEREPGHDCVLNLTPSGRVYRSDYDWRTHPDSVAFLLRTLERDLTQGPAHVQRVWNLGRVSEFMDGGLVAMEPARDGALLRSVAAALYAQRANFTHQDGNEGRSVCYIAAHLNAKLGDLDGTLAALDACMKFSGAEWSPIVEKQLRGKVLLRAKKWEDAIAVYRDLLASRPNVRPYMEGLAEGLEGAGRGEEAKAWRAKADPGAALVGKPAPYFAVQLFHGDKMTLATALHGKKVLLVNFWFCGCGPCRQEFPFLEKLYQAHKDHGLAMIAVNHGDSPEAVAKFVDAGKYTFAVALGRETRANNAIFPAYQVKEYPTNYLIDQDGMIVWRGIGFGAEAKQGLTEALAKLGLK